MAKPITDDMVHTSDSYCLKCVHSWKSADSTIRVCCHYILDTYKSRGCPVGWCNKFEKAISSSRKYKNNNGTMVIKRKSDETTKKKGY